jgi:hypothetical protein
MKFSIRDLLFVTVIVALAVGWGADRWRQAANYRKLEDEFQKQQTEWAAELRNYHLRIVRLKQAAGESLVEPLDEEYRQPDSQASAPGQPPMKHSLRSLP